MPTNPERRTQILDTAIDILCDDGVGGLTHRQVDTRACLPAGTTSNYFRTRQALLEATAAIEQRLLSPIDEKSEEYRAIKNTWLGIQTLREQHWATASSHHQ